MGNEDGPLSIALRSAIAESGLSRYVIARDCDLYPDTIARFMDRKGDIKLSTAVKLFVRMRIAALQGSKADETPRCPVDVLRSAIAESGLSDRVLGSSCGVHHRAVKLFREGRSGLNLASADKLFAKLSVKLTRSLQAAPDVRTFQAGEVNPLADAIRSAIAESTMSIAHFGEILGNRNTSINRFVLQGANIRLSTAGKLFQALSLGVIIDGVSHQCAEALRISIEDRRTSLREVAKQADLNIETVRAFSSRGIDMMLSSADKLARLFKFRVAKLDVRPKPEPPQPNQSSAYDAIRSAIAKSGLSQYELAKRTGTSSPTIRRLLDGQGEFKLSTLKKLADALGVNLASLSKPHKSCPIELRGEGKMIKAGGKDFPPLSGVPYKVLALGVERFPGCCYGTELTRLTGVDRPFRLLKRKMDDPRWATLKDFVKWDGKKGGSLQIACL